MNEKIIIKTIGNLPIKMALYCVTNIIDKADTWGNECGFTFKNHYETIVVFGKKNKDSITFTCYYQEEQKS